MPASTVPQTEQTDSSDSNSPQTEAVTAESLLREIGGNLSKTAYVSGNTAFELLAPTGAESKPGANTISYMFESTRSASVVHTSGTVNKDGASIGVESYIVGKDGGKARLLSCRDGVWQAQWPKRTDYAEPYAGPVYKGIYSYTFYKDTYATGNVHWSLTESYDGRKIATYELYPMSDFSFEIMDIYSGTTLGYLSVDKFRDAVYVSMGNDTQTCALQ